MPRLVLMVAIAALVGAAAAAASTPAQYKAAMSRICRSYTPLLHREQTHLSSTAGVQRLTELAVAEDDRLEAEPIPTVLGATMRPVIAELKVFHAQAAGALREAAADHDSKAFVYLLRMQREKPKLDRLFDGVGLRACGSEQ